MVNPGDPRPVFRQVADTLREEITRGTLKPGDRLPSTRELIARFRVSDGVIRRAIATLKAEGLIEGRQGQSIKVRVQLPRRAVSAAYITPPTDGERDRWTTEGEKAGLRNDQTITFAGLVEPPDDTAELLGLSDSEQVVQRSRVMFTDGEPVELVDSYYPASIAGDSKLTRPVRLRGGALKALSDLGFPPRRVHEVVEARMPTPQQRRDLKLPEGVPLLCVKRQVFSDEDRPIELMVMALGADRNLLEYDIPIPSH